MISIQPDYPRPQFVRSQYQNLNGLWSFAFDDADIGLQQRWYDQTINQQTIKVPFAYQTKASGINDQSYHPVVWYQKELPLIPLEANQRVRLIFEGSDYETTIWVNGQFVGRHQGGYDRFWLDITDTLKLDTANILTVRILDTYDQSQPRGKQRSGDESYGCWYVPTTGIWKTVWLETVNQANLEELKITPQVADSSITVSGLVSQPSIGGQIEVILSYQNQLVTSCKLALTQTDFSVRLKLKGQELYDWGIRLWSIQHPHLYDLQIIITKNDQVTDQVQSYAGLRSVEVNKGQLLLNGQPVYQKLILDQGYWAESGLTPIDDQALVEDVKKIKAMGFNGLRCHQKIEDERLLYWCDVYGLIVYSEMPAAYDFNDQAVTAFTTQWLAAVKQNYNHPSAMVWVPFNESWGIRQINQRKDQQAFTQQIYYLTKTIDPYRPVISNDGWEHTISDILTLHDYRGEGEELYQYYTDQQAEICQGRCYYDGSHPAWVTGFEYNGQPVVISEYGGISRQGEGGWGYGDKADSEQGFIQRYNKLTTAIKKLPYVCGYCYTQLTDVQQETNGLLDENHNYKTDPEKIKAINNL